MSNNNMNPPPEPWGPGTEVIALYTFNARSQEDLPFKKREHLTIVKPTKDPMWYLARKADGPSGMIPANYVEQQRGEVKLHAMPWFHGKMKREDAEEKLMPKEEGLFLVRESNNYPGDYTLCVVSGTKVEHYHIMYKNNQLTIDEDVNFDTLIQLVEHYERDADGLCTRLAKPKRKAGKLEYMADREQFIKEGWVIPHPDLYFGEIIGKGEYGDVFKGEYKGAKVAIKSLKDLRDSGKAAHVQHLLAEASLMTSLRHKNLVSLIGVVLDETVYIVTEFMGKGNLVDYLRSRGRSIITSKDQIEFATDTCKAMAYLEERQLVHRDLAARNVLIAEDCTAKVSDFGLARYADSYQEGGRFPIKWTAPEALRESKFTSKSDMWSFGILLWEIYSFGRVPYPRIPLSDVVMHVEKGYRMEAPEGCPKEVYEIMKHAWDLNPDKRPEFTESLKKLEALTTPLSM